MGSCGRHQRKGGRDSGRPGSAFPGRNRPNLSLVSITTPVDQRGQSGDVRTAHEDGFLAAGATFALATRL